jgi:hypothetical protein
VVERADPIRLGVEAVKESRTAVTIVAKLSSARLMFAASFETSVPATPIDDEMVLGSFVR